MNYGLTRLERAKWTTKKWYRQLLRKIKRSPIVKWDSYVDDTYILHLDNRTDRYDVLNKELSKIKTEASFNGRLRTPHWTHRIFILRSFPSHCPRPRSGWLLY